MANLIIWNCLATAKHAAVRTAGAYAIASWLRQHGYTVKVIDFCHLMTTDELVGITESYLHLSTLAIGVSSTFWDHPYVNKRGRFVEPQWVADARSIIEKRHPRIRWILGGTKAVLDDLDFHWIKFKGLAEDSILKWMDQNSNRYVIRNLFDIKSALYHYVEDDFIQKHEVLPIELGRGCIFKCKFCNYPLIGKKRGTYTKDFNVIKDTFLRNFEQLGVTRYTFLDDTLNESYEKVQALAEIAQRLPFRLEWVGYLRLDLVHAWKDSAELLKQSGLRSPQFGIESFHPRASLSVGKGWNGIHAKDYLLRLKEEWGNDINWTLSFICGLPGETKEDIFKTLNWLIDNDMPRWVFHPLAISHNIPDLWKSEFEKNYEEHGYVFNDLINHPRNWSNDHWTYYQASSFASMLMRKSEPYQKPATWLLAELASMGYEFSDLMNTYQKDLRFEEFTSRTKQFVQKYVEAHK